MGTLLLLLPRELRAEAAEAVVVKAAVAVEDALEHVALGRTARAQGNERSGAGGMERPACHPPGARGWPSSIFERRPRDVSAST
jgi:hypothetical protein